MVFQSSIKVAYDDHSSWIVTPWCSIARYHCCTRCFSVLWLRPIVLWGASDSALFVLGEWFFGQYEKWRFIRDNVRDGSHPTGEKQNLWSNYFHLLDRRDGDKCWKAFNETSKTLKVEAVCQDMSRWCPIMILGPEGGSLKYIDQVRSTTIIVLWFHDIDECGLQIITRVGMEFEMLLLN